MKTIINKIITLLIFFSLLVIQKCYSAICITNETVNDYIDISNLYKDTKQYHKALEYINMIEPHDSNNPNIKYQKAILLSNLNYHKSAKAELQKTILLSPAYACCDLAIKIYKDNNICKK